MTDKKIIITRPEQQGHDFANALRIHIPELRMDDFLFEPMLKIQYFNKAMPEACNSLDGIIVTSVHALHDLDDAVLLGKNFYVVGQATLMALREKGAKNIALCTGTVNDLFREIQTQDSLQKQQFLYLRGVDVAFDLKSKLETAGHSVDEHVVYKACTATALSDEVVRAIKNNEISAITFFSKRTAMVFVSLASHLNILSDLKGIKALCLSEGVLEYLYPIFDETSEASILPDMPSMTHLVQSFWLNRCC